MVKDILPHFPSFIILQFRRCIRGKVFAFYHYFHVSPDFVSNCLNFWIHHLLEISKSFFKKLLFMREGGRISQRTHRHNSQTQMTVGREGGE